MAEPQLKAEITRLTAELNSTLDVRKQLRAEASALREENTQLHKCTGELSDEVYDLKRHMAAKTAEAEELREANAGLQRVIDGLRQESAELNKMMREMEKGKGKAWRKIPVPVVQVPPAAYEIKAAPQKSAPRPSKRARPVVSSDSEIEVIEVRHRHVASSVARAINSAHSRNSITTPSNAVAGPSRIGLSKITTKSRTTTTTTQPSTSSVVPEDTYTGTETANGDLQDTFSSRSSSPLTSLPSDSSDDEVEAARLVGTSSVEPRESPDRKPKREKKEEETVIRLPTPVAAELLESIPAYTITPAAVATHISRRCASATYGGGYHPLYVNQAKVARFASKAAWPNPDLNPCAPTVPGAPGLMFTSRDDCLGVHLRLFARLEKETKSKDEPTVWEYLGEYILEVMRALTPAEFAGQAEKVRVAWAQRIIECKQHVAYRSICARVYLRKTHRDVTEHAVHREITRPDTHKCGFGAVLGLDIEDVLGAFARGEEVRLIFSPLTRTLRTPDY
ncbi:hypothetical protein PLICRDRAFT_693624 [Plicaturopsis crispa FD-325 SS-3]|nr:hypothetical protein PLICRDRAFT_693624 [Plicaturopsis crispa FD-325 SS-3]